MDKTIENRDVKAKDGKKKKPSPQNRIWERERRERLNNAFGTLCKLLPEYEPSTMFSKIDILQKAIKFIENLQKKIKDIAVGKDDSFKKHLHDLDERLENLLARNEDLCELLKKSKINIPPNKHIIIENDPEPIKESEEKEKNVAIKSEKKPSSQKTKETDEQKEPPKTVIPTTSVIKTSSNTLTQSVVLIPSSVLIVSNEGINEKIKCKKKVRASRNKLEIKSIDLIPGQIKNGKIPIRPLKRSTESKSSKKPRKKRKTRDEKQTNEGNSKGKLNINDKKETKVADKIEEIENNKENIGGKVEERLDKIELKSIGFNQTELSSDILEVLQVPNTGNVNQESMSPTAAYLMTFPLVVAGGGKNSANNENEDSLGEEVESSKKIDEPSSAVFNDSNLLDNFSSFFTSNSLYPEGNAPNYSTNYQSMSIDGKTKSTKALPEFTFTLTSTVQTPTTSVISTFDYNLPPKTSLLPDFTFSLTSSTMTPPKTVQSHYTNSTNFASTITTPSNDSKKYYNTNTNFATTNSTYSTFPTYEQPATNFTFSLTSTTKTIPKYTSSSNKSSCLKVEDEILKTPTKFKTPTKNKYDVNWMASQDCKVNNNTSSDFPMLHPIDFPTPTSSFYPNLDITRKSDIFFAHPPGEDNWSSPNKITNFLGEPMPPVPQYLPNLKGDLSLGSTNTISSVRVPSSNISNRTQKKNLNNDSNFLSVRQLVDQNDKHQPKLNNNYSAESLIATSSSNNPKKENFYNYTPAIDSSSLSFNFDYNNYNNNFNCNNQSFTASLIDCSNNVTAQQNYYTNSPIKAQNHQYYQHDAPYYLPEKKFSQNYSSHSQTNKTKSKHFKTNNDYQPPPPPPLPPPTSTANGSSYFPTIVPQVESDYSYSSYHSFNYTSNMSKSNNQCQVASTNTGTAISGSLTNFNLMSICPEISNEKSIAVRPNNNNIINNNNNNIVTSW